MATKKKMKTLSDKMAYHNQAFLESNFGRPVRILSEFLAPAQVFAKEQIKNTIVFFGSARTLSHSEILAKQKSSKNKKELERLKKLKLVESYYESAQKLAQKLGIWANKKHNGMAVCTGGGPGIMEAGNRGASDVGTPSIGLNIKLPFEQHHNAYIDDPLNLQFRYFFMRKYWFMHMAKVLVAFPGGFGTLDELFEVLTLIQTKKSEKIPVVIFGKEYWNNLINWNYLAETGMIDEADLKLFFMTDSVEEAYKYITECLDSEK